MSGGKPPVAAMGPMIPLPPGICKGCPCATEWPVPGALEHFLGLRPKARPPACDEESVLPGVSMNAGVRCLRSSLVLAHGRSSTDMIPFRGRTALLQGWPSRCRGSSACPASRRGPQPSTLVHRASVHPHPHLLPKGGQQLGEPGRQTHLEPG